MKIAFVFPPMWTPHGDGSLQIWNQEVTTRLSRYCDVLVYSGLFAFTPHDSIDGVRYRRFSTRLDNRLLKRFQYIHHALGIKRPLFSTDFWYTAYALKIALDMRKQRCDIVHIYNYPQFARILKWVNPKLRVVLNMHGDWLTQVAFTNLHARLREVDLIVSCSDFVTRSTSAGFPDIASRCRTVPMGVSPDAFSHADHSPRCDTWPARRLLYVGRISPEKGVHVLLDAFELIARRYPDASLTIVGPEWIAPREHIADLSLDGSLARSMAPFYENAYLSQLKQRLSPDAAKRVTFTGLVAHSEVPKYYAAADIYISPSLYESFGMSVIEAMVAGVPVVATRVGAVPDFVSHERSGLLVDAANPVAIADAVGTLITDTRLRTSMPCIARDEVLRRFSWQTICSTLVQAYDSLLNNKAAEASAAS
jgi:glycosyltransferase involved in cell wall biosynthesis